MEGRQKIKQVPVWRYFDNMLQKRSAGLEINDLEVVFCGPQLGQHKALCWPGSDTNVSAEGGWRMSIC